MWWRGTTPCTASLPPRPRRRRSGSSASSECLEEHVGAQRWAGAQQGPACCPQRGQVLPRACCKDGGRKSPQGYKGTCPRPGQARQVTPITAAVWPDPALVPPPGQPSAGTPSTRCWLPGRRRSPPPRGTSSKTGPVRPACPCSSPSVPPWGHVAWGPRCRLALKAQGPASA